MNTLAWVLQIVLAVLFLLHGLLFTVAYGAVAKRVEARGWAPSSTMPGRASFRRLPALWSSARSQPSLSSCAGRWSRCKKAPRVIAGADGLDADGPAAANAFKHAFSAFAYPFEKAHTGFKASPEGPGEVGWTGRTRARASRSGATGGGRCRSDPGSGSWRWSSRSTCSSPSAARGRSL